MTGPQQSPGAPDDVGAPLPARAVLRPIGNGIPLGYLAFALGMVLLAGSALGWVPESESRVHGVLLAAYVVPLELVATLMAYLARDTVGATTLGVFTTSWLGLGLVEVVGAPGRSPLIGVFLSGFAVVVAVLAVVAVPAKPLFAVVLALSVLRSVLSALWELGAPAALQTAQGVVALVIAATAVYTAAALLVEAAWRRPVLPTFRRGAASATMDGLLATTDAGLRSEPGVRQQL